VQDEGVERLLVGRNDRRDGVVSVEERCVGRLQLLEYSAGGLEKSNGFWDHETERGAINDYYMAFSLMTAK
jgi:hypothetical protein